MSRILTIDELKALEVGDWVWIERKYNSYVDKFYAKKIHTVLDAHIYIEFYFGHPCDFVYADYGDKWLAYKNKEQAEGKEDEIRKEVAKEILTTLKDWFDRNTPIAVDIQELAEKYGVEVDE